MNRTKVGFIGVSTVKRKAVIQNIVVLAERRVSLKLGGITDIVVRPKLILSTWGVFLFIIMYENEKL
ncbi:MAG: hypothetical protein K0S41_3305 [Anaerocolumna sp.]|jgi:hypothetical protein|nr:hypothetical protein [Anaerocolumna sp.]